MSELEHVLAETVRSRYKRTHVLLLDLVADMSDAELRWQPQPPGNSIAWMVWHLGRFADGFQKEIAHAHQELAEQLGETQEVWVAERIASQWNLDAAQLGSNEAGIGMATDDALGLCLPDKHVLLGYARRCFALADRAVDAILEHHFAALYASPYRTEPVTIGDTVLANLQHERYHLGQMRYLKKMMRRFSGGDSGGV
ncbi:MAG: DinB family protein [Anaerolineae bacterium]|nr:DinB family protein [Anaerolineae bacterium]